MFKQLLRSLAFLFLVACSSLSSDTLQVEETNFEEEVQLTQNLVFQLNRDVVTEEQLEKWDSTQYLSFEPHVPGRFRWTAPDQLVFSPAAGFKPGTAYRVKMGPALKNALQEAGVQEASIDEENVFNFHTPYLELQKLYTYWAPARKTGQRAEARAKIKFNYPVAPTAAAERLEVRLDGEPVKFDILEADPAAELTVAVPMESIPKERAPELEVRVAEGLACLDCSEPSQTEQVEKTILPIVEQMMVTNVETQHDGSTGSIFVYFTQPIKNGVDPADYVSLEPKVEYKAYLDGNALRLEGSFVPDEAYAITIKEGFPGIFGAATSRKHRQFVSFGSPPKNIEFVNSKGIYLSRRGAQDVALRINHVPKVRIKITKVFENNLVHFLRQQKRYGGHYDSESQQYHNYRYYDTEHYGELVYDEVQPVSALRKQGDAHLLNLRIPDKYDGYQGIFVVDVISEENFWVRNSKIITVTDLGLMSRLGHDELWVAANSIRTAEPLAGIKLDLISETNQVIQTAETNEQGIVVFKNLAGLKNSFQPAMVTARRGNDFNYLHFDQAELETSRFKVGGKYTHKNPYDAFIYCERDLYRPGETLHFNTIVRTWDWQTVPDMPVLVKLLYPNGKLMRELQGTLNNEGAFAADIDLPATTTTGGYKLELYTGAEEYLGSKYIGVEEFMPDRIRVKLRTEKETVRPAEDIVAQITATNLFGPPARNRKYELRLKLQRKAFRPQEYRDYHFSVTDDTPLAELDREGKTNENGQADERFQLPDHYRNIGLLEGTLYATVFDETGRPVHRATEVDIFTQNFFYGIYRFDRYVSTREPLNIPLMVVSSGGTAVRASARVQVVKYNWETVVERNGSRFRYVSKKREQLMSDRTVDIPAGGLRNFSFTPNLSGHYEVRVRKPGSEAYVARSFYAYGYGSTENMAFEVNNEGNVEITTDKDAYAANEQAKILFNTPFEGTLHVTVERDKVLEHHVLKTEKNTAELTLPLPGKYVPNVYVSATLIRPLLNTGSPFTVAHGYKRLRVEQAGNRLPLRLSAAKESRSQRTQTISVQTAPGAEVTFAVVDEGILQLRNMPSPKPYDHFYGNRALEVKPSDLYRLLLPELETTVASTGGGGMADAYGSARRQNPFTNRRVKLVSFWSGPVKADANGNATYSVDIPEFSGELRIMAVAYKGQRFAGAHQAMTVADPVVVSSALPRFLTPGDTVTVPVTVTNTTDRSANFQARLNIDGPVTVLGTKQHSGNLSGDSEQQFSFRIAATGQVAESEIQVRVNAMGEVFTNTTHLMVRPSVGLQVSDGSGEIPGGSNVAVQIGGENYLERTTQSRLIVSRSPMVNLSKHLRYLVRYPHSCLEQTVSAAFPQLYFFELSKAMHHRQAMSSNPTYHVQKAISKIQRMQRYDGSFAYWPGSYNTNKWSTVYAAHFLLEAKRAEYEVNQELLDDALNYIRKQVRRRDMHIYELTNGKKKKLAYKEHIYGLFVLAAAGKPDRSTMNYYKNRPETLSPESKYLLAASFALNGDKRSFEQLLPGRFATVLTRQELEGSFSSPVRDKAIALYVLHQASPKHPQVPVLARQLSQQMQALEYLNTQERAFGFLALGRIAKDAQNSNVRANIVANGRTVGRFNGQMLVIDENLAGKSVEIQTQGNGSLYYFWEASGIDLSGDYKVGDRFLKVRRSFLDRHGNRITGNTVEQNDLVIVKISLTSSQHDNVPNVVITDLLPAGLEVENPRLSSLPKADWIENQTSPDHYDFRDDRVLIYDDKSAKRQTYYYMARAVTPGRFRLGPVGAEAMYDGSYHSYHGGGVFRVLPFGGAAN